MKWPLHIVVELAILAQLVAVPIAASAGQPGRKLLASSESAVLVRSVRALAETDGTAVEIISSRPVVPAISRLENPLRVVIDLPNAQLSGTGKSLDFHSRQVRGVRINQFQQSPPVARVVVDLAQPLGYTWDAAGNRLVVRLRAIHDAKPASAAASTRGFPPENFAGSGPPAAIVLAGSHVPTGSSVTAGSDTAVLQLGRGGQVRVCPGTTVSVTASQNGRSLMLGMSTGALEAHYTLDSSADSIVTPDFRILLAGPGEFHYGVQTDSRGNTCIQALPGNTASAIVSELLGDGTYQVKPTQQVTFRSGHLSEVDSALPTSCGCPPSTPPIMRATLPPTPPATSLAMGPETSTLPASKPNQVHVQVEAPFVFRASDPPPPPSAPMVEARLLPLRDRARPAFPEIAALPPAKTDRHGFFGKLKGFFAAIFG